MMISIETQVSQGFGGCSNLLQGYRISNFPSHTQAHKHLASNGLPVWNGKLGISFLLIYSFYEFLYVEIKKTGCHE